MILAFNPLDILFAIILIILLISVLDDLVIELYLRAAEKIMVIRIAVNMFLMAMKRKGKARNSLMEGAKKSIKRLWE